MFVNGVKNSKSLYNNYFDLLYETTAEYYFRVVVSQT